MSLNVCVLGSGSSGNAIYVGNDRTHLLIDAGLSAKQIALRLERIGIAPEALEAICVSHEHVDHVSGLRVFQKRHGVAVYSNAGTLRGMRRIPKNDEMKVRIFQTGAPFRVGEIVVEPFSVPHDACDPVGFRIRSERTCVGIVTDLGVTTPLVREKMRGCHALVVESNHDEDLLMEAPRPWSLKQRIRSRQGHLSNLAAARLVAECAGEGLEHVFLAHLSSDCNEPDLALRTVAGQLRLDGLGHIRLEVSRPDRVTPVWRHGEKTSVSAS